MMSRLAPGPPPKKPTPPPEEPQFSVLEKRRRVYLVLKKPLSTPSLVQKAARLPVLPQVIEGVKLDSDSDDEHDEDSDGDKDSKISKPPVRVVEVGNLGRFHIIHYLKAHKLPSNLDFFVVNKAIKDFSSYSPYPTLGMNHDTTLPQFRSDDDMPDFRPHQNEYPV